MSNPRKLALGLVLLLVVLWVMDGQLTEKATQDPRNRSMVLRPGWTSYAKTPPRRRPT